MNCLLDKLDQLKLDYFCKFDDKKHKKADLFHWS